MFNPQAGVDPASVRTRFFAGRSQADLDAEMPVLPTTAPFIAPPGPSFVRMARQLGDVPPPPPVGKRGQPVKPTKKNVGRPVGACLDGLVRSALYQDGTVVQFETARGEFEPFGLCPGLLCDGDKAGERYGPGPCRVVVIGKCLGHEELNRGRPFVGPGSRPLWEAWAEAGLAPCGPLLPTFMTNLIRFVPPNNTLTRLPGDWVADGLHLLHQEIAVCRPEVILVLGADALKALLGAKAKVADYRGRLGKFTLNCQRTPADPPDEFTCNLVVADHPAAVARDPDKHPALLDALRRLATVLGFRRAATAVALDHKAVYTEAELVAAVDESVKASAHGGYVSFDCEWDGQHPLAPGAYVYTVQWSHACGHARCLFVRREGGAKNAALSDEVVRRELNRLLAAAPDRQARLVGHFAKADLPWLHSLGVDLYDKFVGPDDEPGADGTNALYGWQKTYYEGGFDTYLAAHATDESAPLKLELQAAAQLGVDRYDVALMEHLTQYCREEKIRKSDLTGYGNVPEDVIAPYGMMDSDVSGRLYTLYNGDPRLGTDGLLDKDRFGNSSRQIFGLRMRAWGAWAEMERYGIEVDRAVHRTQRDQVVARRDELVEEFRAESQWPDFGPTRRSHRVDFLFGESFAGGQSVRPPGALCLYLQPWKSTATSYGGRLWADACFRADRSAGPTPSPAVDKETLVHLSRQHKLVALLRDIDFLNTALKNTFRMPDSVTAPGDDAEEGAEGAEVHERGFLACIDHDGRVRSRFGLVETGRASSSDPNLQNIGGSVDDQYDRILQQSGYAIKDAAGNVIDSAAAKRRFRTRAILRAQQGWYVVGVDLKGAEIAAAGWFSGDGLLIDHARRNNLPEDDPDWLDLHSDLAQRAFKLPGTLKDVKKNHKPLRTAAKRARFGHYYGASPDTILRKALEDDPNVTLENVQEIVRSHDETYPTLAGFFASCRGRVGFGWMCNGFGGTRRFRKVGDRDLRAAQEREAQNWSCQGLVADAITAMLGNLWYELRRRRMRTRIILSVHDSVMFETPPDEIVVLVDEVIPLCMERQPIVITTLDGRPVFGRGPYYFGVDVEVYRNWEVKVPDEEWRLAP